jgi:hypothetical protein
VGLRSARAEAEASLGIVAPQLPTEAQFIRAALVLGGDRQSVTVFQEPHASCRPIVAARGTSRAPAFMSGFFLVQSPGDANGSLVTTRLYRLAVSTDHQFSPQPCFVCLIYRLLLLPRIVALKLRSCSSCLKRPDSWV